MAVQKQHMPRAWMLKTQRAGLFGQRSEKGKEAEMRLEDEARSPDCVVL